ncbi:family 10 glycosylhydrolase, partial [bacterium]|nr:family 10 glycosylhydrolase [bacterium]
MRKSMSIILFLIFILPILTFSQTGNEEFRATWVITWNYSSSSFSVETSQQRIRDVLDNHVKANMNAVLFQVRQSGTAYYQSSYEPWGSYSPQYTDYDPLTFAIEEAHKRGLELHAWFNCFAAASTVSGSPATEHPEWVCRDRDGISMTSSRALSPGLKAVRDYTVDVAMEIINNYDIDGLHLDYVRWNEYSNSKKSKSFAASIDENKMFDGYITDEQIEDLIENKGGRYLYDIDHPYSAGIPNDIPGETFSSWEDYWRWSVTEFVQTLHDSIQSVKPWSRLSAAALGKYRWSTWQGYGTVYQDAALWFNEGFVDQLTPMHYHWTSGSSFQDILDGGHSSSWGYWIQPGIDAGRLFSAGPGSYILLDNKIWYRHKEIIQACRNIDWVDGFQFFSYGSWNGAQYWNEAGETVFKKMTKIRNNVQSGTPTEPTVSLLQNDPLKYEITVTPDAGISENHWFLVYRSEDETISPDEDEIIDLHFGQESYTVADNFPGTQNFDEKYHYAATCLDRYWSESVISNDVISDSIPSYAPIVLKTIPADADTIPVNTSIIFYFSKSIDTTNFILNTTINPQIPLSGFSWTDNNSTVKFLTSGALNFDTQYTINLQPTLTDVNGKALDG